MKKKKYPRKAAADIYRRDRYGLQSLVRVKQPWKRCALSRWEAPSGNHYDGRQPTTAANALLANKALLLFVRLLVCGVSRHSRHALENVCEASAATVEITARAWGETRRPPQARRPAR